MMKRLVSHGFLIAFVLLSTMSSVYAQSGGFTGASTRIGFGPRGMAMGNALAATTSEGIYPHYNPALAAFRTDAPQVDLTFSSLEFDRVFQTVSANFQLPPSAGISFGIIRSGIKDIDERSLSGYPLGTFDASEYQLFTAFGLRLNERFKGGINLKINYANYHPDLSPSTGVGIDLGFLIHITESINLGIAVQDLFSNYTWNSGELYGQDQSANVINTFPTRYKFALAYQHQKFTISTEYEIQSLISDQTTREIFIDGSGPPQVFETTEEILTGTSLFRTGASWKAHERFTVRGGYRITDLKQSGSGSLTAGFSLHLPFDVLSPSIDYAFVMEPYNVANMHVFALRLHL